MEINYPSAIFYINLFIFRENMYNLGFGISKYSGDFKAKIKLEMEWLRSRDNVYYVLVGEASNIKCNISRHNIYHPQTPHSHLWASSNIYHHRIDELFDIVNEIETRFRLGLQMRIPKFCFNVLKCACGISYDDYIARYGPIR